MATNDWYHFKTLLKNTQNILKASCWFEQVDMAELEEGGMFDEDTMPDWMRSMRGVAPNRPPQQQTTIMAAPSPFPEPIQQLPPGFTSSSQLFAS